ncbi:hypothetical protein LPJ61_001457 [Coemansia biformis]|uniref:HpcH/HpaI aldolase/citrate lyase domain-containing protein n=1 Tax=Coemansia biformis TaxID=1286918 RepID=A0A9W7YEU8_9FUNG|nr:hypothetical protein LPJ61_001457 [Coemansia biformis]
MSAHNDDAAAAAAADAASRPSPSPTQTASPEKPTRVVLETEPPARKPGRPRLDISAHFQDTGEMANHSHRLVWCIGCIKSGRLLYKKDRLPARGDLMQRHLQTCKHVADDVRLKFSSQRSSSTSSAGENKSKKARVANIVTEAGSSGTQKTHGGNPQAGAPVRSRSRLRSATTASTMAPESAPVLPPISAVSSCDLGRLATASAPVTPQQHQQQQQQQQRHSVFANNRPAGDGDGAQLPRIRPPLPPLSIASMDLPPLAHRAHPYLGRDSHHAQNGGTRHHSHLTPDRPARSPPRIHTPPAPQYQRQPYLPPPPASRGPHLPHAPACNRIASPEPAYPAYASRTPPLPAQAISQIGSALTGASALHRRLRYGRDAAIGIVLTIPSAVTARAAARLGFDWACIDMGNSLQPAGAMAEMVAAIASSGSCAPLVRVPSFSTEWIRWAVEAGAHGVIVSGIQSREQMWRVVNTCRDIAARAGYAPALSMAGGGVLVIPQIEHLGAGSSVEEILSVPGVDAAFVRSPAMAGGANPAPSEALGHVLRVGRQLGVPLGIDSMDGGGAHESAHWGFQMVSIGSDFDVLATAAADQLRLARSA